MIKLAVIPWGPQYEHNEMFNINSPTNGNGLTEAYAQMRGCLEEHGYELNTIDMYSDLTEVDWFLFFIWSEEWLYKLAKLGLESRMIYCNGEPPTVNILNTPKGYEKLKHYFPYIMTWNKECVDNDRIFYRTIPYNFVDHRDGTPYSGRKLLTNISANKKSTYPDELYSLREELVSYFETNLPDGFDLYGSGWDANVHPSYKGSPRSKFDVYNKYKFALAFENTRNVRGYVTEKIFDCLTCGIVPIYLGADDICDYVPEDCFIDYRKFSGEQELMELVTSMSDETYTHYLRSAEQIFSSKELHYSFSGDRYAGNILYLINNAQYSDFGLRRMTKILIAIKWLHLRVKRIGSALKHSIRKMIIY